MIREPDALGGGRTRQQDCQSRSFTATDDWDTSAVLCSRTVRCPRTTTVELAAHRFSHQRRSSPAPLAPGPDLGLRLAATGVSVVGHSIGAYTALAVAGDPPRCPTRSPRADALPLRVDGRECLLPYSSIKDPVRQRIPNNHGPPTPPPPSERALPASVGASLRRDRSVRSDAALGPMVEVPWRGSGSGVRAVPECELRSVVGSRHMERAGEITTRRGSGGSESAVRTRGSRGVRRAGCHPLYGCGSRIARRRSHRGSAPTTSRA